MLKFYNNRPQLKDKNTIYTVLLILFSIIGLTLLMLPVVVNLLNGFSTISDSSEKTYYILRGLFGISIGVGTAVFAVKKDIFGAAVPCFIGFITALFPLYDSVAEFTSAYSIAKQLSMNIGYGPYLITIGENLLFTLLCIFTCLYSVGLLKKPFIIVFISVMASLSTLFTLIDKYVTYDITLYEILSLAYTVIISIVPIILVLSTKTTRVKSTRYKARRMR